MIREYRMSCPFGYTADGKDDGVAAATAGCPGAAKDESGGEKARYFCLNVTVHHDLLPSPRAPLT